MALITTAEREALLQRAITVRDEIMLKANTANRVGSLFYDIVQMFASVDLEELRKYFLRKDVDDETLFMLTMAEAWVKGDLTFGSKNPDHATGFVSGIKGCKIYWNGSGWAIETDYLSVNKRMYAKSIQVDEVTHVGGENLLTDASCIADRVFTYPTFYRVFFRKKNGEGRTIYNKFRKGDQAYCQIFNIDAGLTHDFTNRYYWRLVVNTSNNISETYDEGTEELLDEFHFIDLSKLDCDTAGDIRMDANAASVPQPEDPIVQLGYQRQQGDDDALVAERQGATLISGGGRYKRAIVMWEGIDSFRLPNPRIYFSPNRVEMTVDSLKIRTSGSDKPIEQYVDSNQSQFLIFETESTDVPTLLNLPYTGWSEAERELYSTEPNNAVVLNSDGRTWRFVKDGNSYAFVEFTDPWLLAQHKDIKNILDDGVITADEIPQLQLISGTIAEQYHKVVSEYEDSSTVQGSPLSTQYNRYVQSYNALNGTSQGNYGYFYDISNLTPPIYLNNYNGPESVTKYRASRSDILYAIAMNAIRFDEWNKAYNEWKATQIAERKANDSLDAAKDYVDGKIQGIMSGTIDEYLEALVQQYIENETELVTHSEFEAQGGLLSALTTWVGKDAQSDAAFGQTGLAVRLNNLFLGTASVSFVKDGNDIIYYDISGRRIYQDNNGLYWLDDSASPAAKVYYKDTDPSAEGKTPKEYGTPLVSNISKAGLVTSENFAALTTRVVNVEGAVVSSATIATWISDAFGNDTNAARLKSHILITADDVKIESGDKSMGDYFSLNNGNLWCQNITVQGVYNNLITVVDWNNRIGRDKIIVVYFDAQDEVLAYTNADGAIVDPLNQRENAMHIRCYLDAVNCGDMLVIKSLPAILLNTDKGDQKLRLPFFIDTGPNRQERGFTRFNDTDIHLITPDELRMMVGKKMTIRTTIADSLWQEVFLTGQKNLCPLDVASAPAINNLANGLPFYLDRNGENDIVSGDQRLNGPKTMFMEFKLCEFFSTTNIATAARSYGYVWVGRETYAAGAVEDLDTAWADQEEGE